MNKTKKIIIIVVSIICAIILGVVIGYLILNKRGGSSYEKISGGADELKLITELDKFKIDFLAKNKVLYVSTVNKKNNYLIYDVIQIIYGIIDRLSKNDESRPIKYKDDIIKHINSICDKNSKDDKLFICGLSLERFKKIYENIDKTKQYKTYYEKHKDDYKVTT